MIRKAPILWFVIPMMAGVWLSERFGGEVWRYLAICCILFAGCVTTMHRTKLFIPVFFSSAIAFGYIWTLVMQPQKSIPYGKTTCEMTITAPPEEKDKTVKAVVTLDLYADSNGYWKESENKAVVYIAKDSISLGLKSGDRLRARLQLEEPFEGYDPEKFNYRRFLKRKGILYQSYIPEDRYTILTPDSTVQGKWAEKQQQKLIEIIERSNLSPAHKGLAKALCLGYKSDIDEMTHRQFKVSGITHLLCVSGLHVGIFAAMIGYLLFFLGRERKQVIAKCIIKILSIWLFVAITGMAPASVRAGLMFSILIIGDTFFQRPNRFNAIATAALVMLLVNPMNLFDVGFQLSFAAVAGITGIGNNMRRLIRCDESLMGKILQWIWGLFCVTTSAQIATLPFVLYYFNQFPLYFMIANMTIVPFAGVLLGGIILLIAVGSWPWASFWVGKLLSVAFTAIDKITLWIASLPHALIDNIAFHPIQAVFLAAAIVIAGILLDSAVHKIEAKRHKSPLF